jgi:crotonobetainyl-CoA:carnitine CoA-transferase CaiB-like acyl-CoA transferase
MGGFMSITGEEHGGPLRAGVAMADISTGMYATVSMLAALRHAERTGEGQHIDISLLDTQIATLANQASNWLVGGVNPGRMGNRHPTVVPYKTFRVKDGEIIIAVGNDGQFRSFCVEMGRPELADDPRFVTGSQRLINRDAIEGIFQEIVADLEGGPLVERLVAVNVPAGPVNTIRDIFADPFIAARKTVHRFVREDGVEIPPWPFRPSCPPRRPTIAIARRASVKTRVNCCTNGWCWTMRNLPHSKRVARWCSDDPAVAASGRRRGGKNLMMKICQ